MTPKKGEPSGWAEDARAMADITDMIPMTPAEDDFAAAAKIVYLPSSALQQPSVWDMKQPLIWDIKQANSEGWTLSCNLLLGCWAGGIRKLHNMDVFQTDNEAFVFVVMQAAKGSNYHKAAMQSHLKNQRTKTKETK